MKRKIVDFLFRKRFTYFDLVGIFLIQYIWIGYGIVEGFLALVISVSVIAAAEIYFLKD